MSLEIYPARKEDIDIIGLLHVEGLKSSYAGIVDKTYIESLDKEEQSEKWRKWLGNPEIDVAIAYLNNNPVGFVAYGQIQTAPPGQSAIRPLYSAEIMGLYVLEAYWEQGIGRALVQYAAKELKEKKHTSLCLWVMADNKRACSFYERLGGQRIGKHKTEIAGRLYKEACYGWRHTSALIV